MVRVDEHLKIKYRDLCSLNSDVDGWTPLTAQENLKHKRIVNSMRCFINMVGVNYFHHQLLSQKERTNIRNAGLDLQGGDFVDEGDDILHNIVNVPSPELDLFLETKLDRKNSDKLFSELVKKIYVIQNMSEETEQEIIKAILNNVIFCIE